MQYGNPLSAALQALGNAVAFVTDDIGAVIDVDTAGAAKDATTIPVKATTVALYKDQILFFGSQAKYAILTADAAKGATSLTCEKLTTALVDADLAYPWETLGAIEADITENGGWTENALVAAQTGDVPHQVTVTPARVSLSIPVIAGGKRFWKLCEPHGDEDGIPESDFKVKEKALFLIPVSELADGIGCPSGGTWTPAAPENSLFFPRCYLTRGPVPRPRTGGGKSTVTITATAMYQSSGPVGKRVYVRGDPYAKGYTSFMF